MQVNGLAFVGQDALFLAAASASVLHLFVRSQMGPLNDTLERLGLSETYARTRANIPDPKAASILDSKSLVELALSASSWKPLEFVQSEMQLTAVCGCGSLDGSRAMVALGSYKAGIARILDLSQWQAAVKARSRHQHSFATAAACAELLVLRWWRQRSKDVVIGQLVGLRCLSMCR